MNDNYFEHILGANEIAMKLYRVSRETLMESSSCDFMVYRFHNWDEVLEDLKEWDDYTSIDEETYNQLYNNLCIKLRDRFK